MFNKKDIIKHNTAKAEKCPIEIHNVISHTGGWVGSYDFVTKCERG